MTTWAYDIETANWTDLVVAAAVADDGRKLVMRSAAETAAWYKSLPTSDEVIAHNGGAFDFLQLIEACADLTWHANMAGGSIVSCRAKGHAQCRDSFRLFPLSLAKWTRQKSQTGLECECGRNCGGYCAIKRGMRGAKLAALTGYCMNDCEVLLRTWLQDIERLCADGLLVRTKTGIRGTIGGVAWHTGAAMAGLDPDARPSWEDYMAGRAGYYGGRTEVGQVASDIDYMYDANAVYPWALTQDVPIGERVSYTGQAASQAYGRDELGLYRADVVLPVNSLPALPHRLVGKIEGRGHRHSGDMIWSTGHVNGTWSGIELRAAERHGAKILRIDRADVWVGRAPVFRPYVEMIYAARRKAIDAGDDRWGAVLKWFANSLSGKLAQRPVNRSIVILGDDELPMGGWEQVGGLHSRVWATAGKRETPKSGLTWVAATLTARARVKLLDRLMRHEDSWLYCDTDSTHLSRPDEQDVHQSRLGAFKYEGKGETGVDPISGELQRAWEARAPKFYRSRHDDGTTHVRIRGVPRATWATYDELASGRTVSIEAVARLRSGEGRFKRRNLTRSHHDVGSRWVGTRRIATWVTGRTRPLHRLPDGSYA